MLRAAADNKMQVIWDLCHYGWPDGLDIFSPAFVDRFAGFARAFARLVMSESNQTPYFTPVNEISFFAWAAGEVGYLNPFRKKLGDSLKAQLVRAQIAAIDAVRDVHPGARIVQVDPLIHIVTHPGLSALEVRRANAHLGAMYDAWDMVAGHKMPELGGSEAYLDIVGANYYMDNQWVHKGTSLERTHPQYRPFCEILSELYHRYRKPIFVAETGIEDERRPEWLAYICDEVITALRSGIPIEGVCLYPILNHPGWDNERHCHNGLWDYCNDSGDREVYNPLAEELARQQFRISQVLRDLKRDRNSIGVSV
jgi:beta-glucosidase/6-phospho-beta-glucosidase/beta-galactosidase